MIDNETFFQLLRLGLGTEKACEDMSVGFLAFEGCADQGKAWKDMLGFGAKQGVAAIMLDGLQTLMDSGTVSGEKLPSRDVRLAWANHAIQVEKLCKSQYAKASELADIYAEHGIRTVVMKGIAAGLCYPNPNHRPCGDLDCFLMGRYEDGNIIAEENGAKVNPFHYKHSQIIYKGLVVENHHFCTAIRGSKRTKGFERLLQSLLKEEGTTTIDSTRLECPSPMFNALFLTYHAQSHFLVESGIALRHLCDWAMFLDKYGYEMDWVKFKQYCDEYGLARFAETMTRLAWKILHVRIPNQYVIEMDDERDDYLLNEIMGGFKDFSSGSVWKQRIELVMNVLENRKRYKMFADVSYMRGIWQLVYGFCFDRNPKI